MQEHEYHANMPWRDEHAFVSPKTPVMLVGHASHTRGWLSRVHVLVMDYAGHARGGMAVMLTGHASHARGGMPVTDYAGHARLHASHACRGMPVTLEHARHAVGMLKA